MLKIQSLLSDKYEICYIEVNGKHLAIDFIDSLPDDTQKKINRIFVRTAQKGPPSNKRKFRKLGCKGRAIFEFKSDAARILCTFIENRKIVLSHGFTKGKKVNNEIKKAQRFFDLI